MKSTRKSYKNKKLQKKKSSQKNRRSKIKGGYQIPNYALNNYNEDPNYMQISSRNVIVGGKRKTKKSTMKGGGSFFDFAANQSSNSISNFPNNSNNILFGNHVQNSAAYVQPIDNKIYTGALVS